MWLGVCVGVGVPLLFGVRPPVSLPGVGVLAWFFFVGCLSWLLLLLLLVFFLPLLRFLLFLRLLCRWLRCPVCLGVAWFLLPGLGGRRLPLRFSSGWLALLCLLSAALVVCLPVLCLPWFPSFGLLSGLGCIAVLVSVARGRVVAGSVRSLLLKLASSALLPSGGLGCGGLLFVSFPARGFRVFALERGCYVC